VLHVVNTSPMGAVEKYCNEYVCLLVCVSVCPWAYVPNDTHDLCQILCLLSVAVSRSSSGQVNKSQGRGAVSGVFFPVDNALYSIAFGTHTKTAEPIEIPFWVKTRVGSRNHVLDGGADPLGEVAILGGCPCHSKALTIFTVAVVAAFAAKGIIQLPITSCKRRDHSVCRASANNILKISGRRRCGLSAAKGAVG